MPIADRNQFTLAAVMDALVTKLSDRPYSEVTISELCRVAGISRMTFYRHFDSKDDVVESYMEKLYQDFQKGIVRSRSIEAYLCYENLLLGFRNIKSHIRYVDYICKNNLGEILIRKLIADEMELFNPQTDEERYLCVAYTSAVYGVLVTWAQEGMTASPEELSRMIVDLFAEKVHR